MTEEIKKNEYRFFSIMSLIICFYAMGAIEMVGIASNYIRVELHTSDAKANLLPSLVYIWFLIITVPAGLLMNKIGRKNAVLLSMSLMLFAMLFPLFGASYNLMLFSFILLGISYVSFLNFFFLYIFHLLFG